MNEMVLYLWRKLRTIPFFIVLLGIWFNFLIILYEELSLIVHIFAKSLLWTALHLENGHDNHLKCSDHTPLSVHKVDSSALFFNSEHS